MNFFKRWNFVVPLQEGCRRAYTLNGPRVDFPNWIDHGMLVSIQNVFLKLGMSRDVYLGHPLCGHAIHVVMGIEVVISRRYVDVVDVQENSAVGGFHDLGKKLPLGHLGNVKFGIAAYVLNGDRDFKKVPDFADFLRGLAGSLEG